MRRACAIGLVLSLSAFACSKSDGSGTNGVMSGGAGGGGANSTGSGGEDASSGGSSGGSSSGGSSSSAGAGGGGGSATGSGGSTSGGSGGASGGQGGAPEQDAGSAGEGAACGSRGLPACAGDLYCHHEIADQCGEGDAPGECRKRPSGCDIIAPVCGCDGEGYQNACNANNVGMSVRHVGYCDSPPPPDCILDGILCDSLPPECGEFEVPTQALGCYGPCVPIEQCLCNGPDDCPDRDQFNCHLSAGHCGPYVN